ncbi:MAG: flavodoxin family protein [Candidatus Hodarchaeota archaeon]
MTRVFVMNGSPRLEKGNTAMVLTPFIEGMKKAGAKVELFYATRLKINPCIGDFQCWFKKVGECIHKDDMLTLYPKLRETDILVLATPVYIPLPGAMQNFLNRLCPIVEPYLEIIDGRTRARFPSSTKISKIVLICTSGWWEIENCDTVLRIAKELALDANTEFTGAVLRPHASELRNGNEKTKEVFDALKIAGSQLIEKGRITGEILRVISQPLVPEKEYLNAMNKMYLDAKKS